ncbi:MFS transporter [Sphingopyxis sp.]|uniref:MFS transporter n=1 Tax=Sphingopyxis sp. TaxID=1908224 RepID=UPI003BA9B015
MIAPIQQEYGWSRAAISSGLTIVSVTTVIGSPFVGRLIDRLGARRIALTGVFLYSVAMLALPLAGPTIWTWWLGWLFVASGSILIKPTVWSAAVVSRFERHRGIALAFALCGSGIASMIGPPILNWLTGLHGWRSAYLAIGGLGLFVILPLVWLLFFDASDLRRTRNEIAIDPSLRPGLSAADGFRSRAFIHLATAGFLATAAGTGMLVHFVPIVTGGGLDRASAAAAAGAFGVAALIARFVTGVALDHIDGRIIGLLAFSIPVFAPIILLGYDGSVLWAATAAALLGLAIGAEIDVLAYLSARYFGLKNYGLLWGTVVGLIALGSGTGPLVAGLIYDSSGNYQLLFHLAIPALLVCASLLLLLGRAPDFGAGETSAHG